MPVSHAVAPRCEWSVDPLGIDTVAPRFSWRVEGPPGWMQAGYEVEVTRGDEVVWAPGRVEGGRTTGITYGGPPLRARETYGWRVRSWGCDGAPTEWSPAATFEMGLLEPTDWHGRWIQPRDDPRAGARPCPLLRREFTAPAGIVHARLYVTAEGIYRAELNGTAASADRLRPGWTAYQQRLQYQTYDVTALVRPGANALGVVLADGWWRGELGFRRRRDHYGDRLALLAQLELTTAAGTERIVTDDAWRWAAGPWTAADLVRGEAYDARRAPDGWSHAGFDDGEWRPVEVVERPIDRLVAQHGAPVRVVAELRPAVVLGADGDLLLDVGQSICGVMRIAGRGRPGDEVTLRHGEAVVDGALVVDNITPALADRPMQELRYTFRGDADECFEPQFSTNGFRFVQVTGAAGALDVDRCPALVLQSDVRTIGTFACSDPRLDRLHERIVRTQRANICEIPTDCPTRERMGWTGDIQVFARTALFTMDLVAWLERWLADLAAEQQDSGAVSDTVPAVSPLPLFPAATGSTAWGDAATVIPWLLYQRTGDPSILRRQLPSMRRWVRYLERRAARRPRRLRVSAGRAARGHRRFLVDSGFHYGDWLAAGRDSVWSLPRLLVRADAVAATAYFAESTRIVGEAAAVLGDDTLAAGMELLRDDITSAFSTEFLNDDGELRPASQTNCVLALAFDLLPAEARPSVAAQLATLVRDADCRLVVGFLGAALIGPVLADAGYLDLAYGLLLQEEPRSWLYADRHDATTVWESPEAVTPDGRVRKRSLNHVAFASVGDFLHRYVAGLDVARMGLGDLRIAPRPGGGVTAATAAHESVHGWCRVAWKRDTARARMHFTVPPNVRADVDVRDAAPGAPVRAVEAQLGVVGETAATPAGDAQLAGLAPGEYTVEYACAPGERAGGG